MKISKSNWLNLAMIATLLAIAVVAQRLSPMLQPKADVIGRVEPGCDLQRQTCTASLPDGAHLRLSITPRPIAFLQALHVEVTVSGITPRKLEVDFAGARMNMGYNRSPLVATGPQRYVGESSLPVCVSGSMTWVATVMVETDRQRIAVPFRFDVEH